MFQRQSGCVYNGLTLRMVIDVIFALFPVLKVHVQLAILPLTLIHC